MIKNLVTFIKDSIFTFFQIISVLLTYIVDLFLRPEIERDKDMIIPPGTLVISNHQSFLDPWIVSRHLGTKNLLHLLPIRYPMASDIARIPILGQITWCLGCFDIGKTSLEKAKNLLFMRELIRKKYTVVLFPEGKRVKSDEEKAEFKRGMNLLVSENIPFILVRISGLEKISIFRPSTNKIKLSYSNIIQNVDNEKKMEIISEFFSK